MKKTTVLLTVLCLTIGCNQQPSPPQSFPSSKPEHGTPSYVPQKNLIDMAVQAMRDKGLEKKYNLRTGVYVATPSQVGEDIVVFCLMGAGTPLTGDRAVDCIVHVSSLSPMNNIIRIEELNPDGEKRLFVSVDHQGKSTGYGWKKRKTPTKPSTATE